jgi:Second Messenger Oligonucleotide or Dinucleotide Synthetase domain
MSEQPKLSKRVIEQLVARNERNQWEVLIAKLLKKLEIDEADLADAKREYAKLADRIATKLEIPRHDVEIFPQGSMRTQTTINQRYPTKFDLDIVAKLSGPLYDRPDPELMFAAFGKALVGDEAVTGEPKQKRRCWRLDYPNKRYYFDITPAVRDQTGMVGSALSVRDPDTRWSPSNPVEFADWFCAWASKRFPFQERQTLKFAEARANAEPIPDAEIPLDDILRRVVQLMKLHRDTEYWGASDKKQECQPISVIIVTLATKAYGHLLAVRPNDFNSPIEVALAVVEEMPNHFDSTGSHWRVDNPRLKAENFADRWNGDDGARAREFALWHGKLERDLEALLHQSSRAPAEERIRAVFGSAGLEAWKESRPKANVLDGLVASGSSLAAANPSSAVPMGSRNTLG